MCRRRLTRDSRTIGVVAACTFISIVVYCQQIFAGEERIAGRDISTVVDAKVVEIGDVKGHVLGSYEGKGVTLHSDGETSTFIKAVVFDYLNGVGSHQGYKVRTYSDGAISISTFRGTTKRTAKGRNVSGSFEIKSGTGRLAGASGKGTYDGFSTKVDMNIIDWKGTIHIPAK